MNAKIFERATWAMSDMSHAAFSENWPMFRKACRRLVRAGETDPLWAFGPWEHATGMPATWLHAPRAVYDIMVAAAKDGHPLFTLDQPDAQATESAPREEFPWPDQTENNT